MLMSRKAERREAAAAWKFSSRDTLGFIWIMAFVSNIPFLARQVGTMILSYSKSLEWVEIVELLKMSLATMACCLSNLL